MRQKGDRNEGWGGRGGQEEKPTLSSRAVPREGSPQWGWGNIVVAVVHSREDVPITQVHMGPPVPQFPRLAAGAEAVPIRTEGLVMGSQHEPCGTRWSVMVVTHLGLCWDSRWISVSPGMMGVEGGGCGMWAGGR